jgi:F-type H+-transporting ATPase subunit b
MLMPVQVSSFEAQDMSQSTIVVAQATIETPAHTETPAQAGEAAHTAEGTGAEGGHGAFPPMDAKSFPSQIFWLVIFFGLLYLLMSKVVLPKLGTILEKRANRISGDLARAQALKDETEAAVQAYEKALADARTRAQTIATETRVKMTAEIDAERSALDKTLAAKIADAEATIAAAKAKAMKDVSDVAAETAATIVAELTGAKVTKAAAADAIANIKA